MTWDKHDGINLEAVPASVLIISDSLFSGERELTEDESGPIAIDLLSNYGFESINLDYYPDEIAAIKSRIENDVSQKVGLILLIGGTGIAPRDVTIEAVQDVMEKELPGFGEEFRRLSFEQVKEKALLSRSIAGTRGQSLIVAVPGAPNAVEMAIDLIGKIINHVLQLLKSEA